MVTLPFYSCDTQAFADAILKYKEQEDLELATIPFDLFKESFESWPGWEDHFEEGTPLMSLMHHEYFRPYHEEEGREEDISVDRLLLLGVLLCKGNS